MKSVLTSAAWMGLAVSFGSLPLLAQLQDNTAKQMTCDNGNRDGDQARHCDIREQTLPSTGSLNVDAGQNGGVTVKGALRSDVLVRARVEAWADTDAAAAAVASRISVGTSTGQLKAIGPESADSSGWSVSYEIFVPQTTDVTIKAHNGGIAISDVRGQLRFDTQNGGVHLKRVAGDVSGQTVNGGVNVELTGAIWEGRQLEATTRNGGISVSMPSYYSAHFQAETRNGRIQSDFPMTTQAEAKPRSMDLNVGSGGPLIHLTTVNGGVRLQRVEAQ
jgi:DUF4097 and DUF4098 domain-containing protein YvlB